jgi:hypothetical protein
VCLQDCDSPTPLGCLDGPAGDRCADGWAPTGDRGCEGVGAVGAVAMWVCCGGLWLEPWPRAPPVLSTTKSCWRCVPALRRAVVWVTFAAAVQRDAVFASVRVGYEAGISCGSAVSSFDVDALKTNIIAEAAAKSPPVTILRQNIFVTVRCSVVDTAARRRRLQAQVQGTAHLRAWGNQRRLSPLPC